MFFFWIGGGGRRGGKEVIPLVMLSILSHVKLFFLIFLFLLMNSNFKITLKKESFHSIRAFQALSAQWPNSGPFHIIEGCRTIGDGTVKGMVQVILNELNDGESRVCALSGFLLHTHIYIYTYSSQSALPFF